MGVHYESYRRWTARREGGPPRPDRPRGRPEVIPEPARTKIREQYLAKYGQWGPAVLADWARREGLCDVCPATISTLLEDIRDVKEPKETPRRYEIIAPMVMWSEDGAGFMDFGKKKELLILQDECSRFKVHTRLANGPATSDDVLAYLKEAFEEYGPPLLLKHDGDSIFHEKEVEALLEEHHVISLTSPPHYPPFNGKMERAVRDFKSYERAVKKHNRKLKLRERLDLAQQDLNEERPRPVLGGRTAREVFEEERKFVDHSSSVYMMTRRHVITELVR